MGLKHSLLFNLLIVLLLASVGYAQPRTSRRSQKVTITSSAAKEWKTFYLKFLAAVRKRDRTYLRSVMDKDFEFSFGESPGDLDRAFQYFDDRKNYKGKDGWQVLRAILAKGVVQADLKDMQRGDKRPTYVAPPRAGTGYRTRFQFFDGRWHWMYFVAGD